MTVTALISPSFKRKYEPLKHKTIYNPIFAVDSTPGIDRAIFRTTSSSDYASKRLRLGPTNSPKDVSNEFTQSMASDNSKVLKTPKVTGPDETNQDLLAYANEVRRTKNKSKSLKKLESEIDKEKTKVMSSTQDLMTKVESEFERFINKLPSEFKGLPLDEVLKEIPGFEKLLEQFKLGL